MTQPEEQARLYHLAARDEWEAAQRVGHYLRSTLDRSLDEEGFIHASFAPQLRGTADRFYQGRADIVLLTIDPTRVDAEIKVEQPPGAPSGFPHIYGPLPVSAVVDTTDLALRPDGTLDLPAALDG